MVNSETDNVIWLVVGSLILGLLFDILFLDHNPGLNFFLFVIAIVLIGLFLAGRYRAFPERGHFLLVIPAIFFATMVAVRASELLVFFNVVATGVLLLLVAKGYLKKPLHEYLTFDYFKIFVLPLWFIIPVKNTLTTLFSLRLVVKEYLYFAQIVRGIVLAIVVLIVFGGLFVSADLILQKYLSDFFIFNLNPDLIPHLISIAIVSIFFCGGFSYAFREPKSNTLSPTEKARTFGRIEMMILLGTLHVLFIGFIVLQATYLFGGVEKLFALGLTYAEYARRGFFEIVGAALLAYLVITKTEVEVVKEDGKHLTSFKLLAGGLALEVVLVLISAFYRLSLYEDAYGFTIIRLYSHALMIWIAVASCMLLLHILINGNRQKLIRNGFISIILLLMAMNAINPDAYIAKQNISRYQNEKKELDIDYLTSLSDDAVPVTLQMFDNPNQEVRSEFIRWLKTVRGGNYRDSTDWQAYTLSRARAQKLLAPYQSELKQ